MAWTPEDLIALDDAIKTGAKEVEYHDKRIIYRSLEEMLRIRLLIIGDLGSVGLPRRRRYYASVSKGTRP